MNKIKKNRQLILITIIIFLMTTIFTVQGYQEKKKSYQEQDKQTLNDILDSCYLYNQDMSINAAANYSLGDNLLSVDKKQQIISYNQNELSFSVANNETANLASIEETGLDYNMLKAISLQIQALSQNNEEINITFNYDGILSDHVFYCQNLSYLAINDTAYLLDDSSQITTQPLQYINTPFITWQKGETDDSNSLEDYSGNIDYLETFLKDALKNDKLHNGYYEEKNPANNPHQKESFTNLNNQEQPVEYTYYVQELSGKYSRFYNRINDSSLELNKNPETQGYLVWCKQTNDPHSFKYVDYYHFSDYLSEHFYNYLITLASILLCGIIINRKKEFASPVAIEPIISTMIKENHNLVIFKKLTINYIPQSSFLYGEKELVNRLIKLLFSYVIDASKPESVITIKPEKRGISFITDQTFDLTKELLEAKIIINHCHFNATFNEKIISIMSKK